MSQQRTKILNITFCAFFCLIIVRLFYWQIIKSPELKEKVLLQTYKLEKIIPERGKIFSSDNFPLVLNKNTYFLSLYKPNLKEDINNIITQVDNISPNFKQNNLSVINNFISNSAQKWISFPTQFSQEESEKLNIPGISFEKTENRFLPEDLLAKNIIGFLGSNDLGNKIGYNGLEGYYDKQLKGKTGFLWTSKDATGKTILTKKSWQSDTINGRDLYTHINRSIQYQAENALKKGIEKFSADSGSIIIMDPKTGGILAMTSLIATESATPSASRNAAISDLFEPGSIFKPLVVTMALDKHSITTDFICTKCNQSRTIGEYTINNWNSETHPNSTLQDIIKNSDNIGMSYVIEKLGLNNFLDYFHKLGLTQKTGIDLQGESKPLQKEIWPEIDLATASFGQGIAITQIQMIQAFNVLANNGYLAKPHVVNYFVENGKTIKNNNQQNQTKIFSPEAVNEIKSILKYAAENGVIAKIKPKDLEVCTKSGTAQIAVKGGYTDSAAIASYVGFSPCNNPKFTMIITINNPKSSSWGSSTAAPIWFELAPIISHLL